MSRFRVLFVLCCLTSLAAVQPVYAADQAEDPHPETLRVISYNVWYVFNHGKQIKEGQAWLKSHAPDVVALQELTDIKPEKLEQLAAGWDHPNSVLLKTSGFSVGLTSRWPIEVVTKQLEGMHHGYLHAKTNGVHYFVVHLSPFKWSVREREAKIVLKEAAPLVKQGKSVIILGDFNAMSPDDEEVLAKTLVRDKSKASDDKHEHVENLRDGQIDFEVMRRFFDAGLHDTTVKHLPAQPKDRNSCPTGVFDDQSTPPAEGQRIDFILSTEGLFKAVETSSIPKEGPVNVISDHYPVITDFEMGRK